MNSSTYWLPKFNLDNLYFCPLEKKAKPSVLPPEDIFLPNSKTVIGKNKNVCPVYTPSCNELPLLSPFLRGVFSPEVNSCLPKTFEQLKSSFQILESYTFDELLSNPDCKYIFSLIYKYFSNEHVTTENLNEALRANIADIKQPAIVVLFAIYQSAQILEKLEKQFSKQVIDDVSTKAILDWTYNERLMKNLYDPRVLVEVSSVEMSADKIEVKFTTVDGKEVGPVTVYEVRIPSDHELKRSEKDQKRALDLCLEKQLNLTLYNGKEKKSSDYRLKQAIKGLYFKQLKDDSALDSLKEELGKILAFSKKLEISDSSQFPIKDDKEEQIYSMIKGSSKTKNLLTEEKYELKQYYLTLIYDLESVSNDLLTKLQIQ